MGLSRKEESVDAGRTSRRTLVTRFILAGATAGLLVGVFEAGLLYFIPWVPTLYSSDLSYVIWFLAPLIDLSLFGLLGLALGALAAVGKAPSPARSVVLAATVLGAAGAHVAWSLDLLHVWVGDLRVVRDLRTPAIWFGVVFACALFLARLRWQGATRLLDAKRAWPLRPWAKALATVTVLLVLALSLHLAKPFVGSISTPAASSASLTNPNIILITLDTVRADHLSSYGYFRPTTPNLDRLARQGVLFENAIAPSSWTLPAHASIFTALLPHQHGANAYMPLDGSPRTLAEVLKSHGYETAGFIANGYGLSGWGLHQGFHVYDDNSSLLRHNLVSTLVGRVLVQPLYHRFVHPDFYFRRTAPEINRNVLRWFQHRPHRPFFLFINYFDTHDPYFVPAPYHQRFGKISEAAVRRVTFGEGFPLRPPLSVQEENSLIAGYDNCLAFLDEQVGSLLQALALSSPGSNTIVIITSDHGDAFGEHGMYLHGRNLYYREALHVPLIIFGPGIPAGLRIAHPVRLRELFPFVLDLALPGQLPFGHVSLRRFWTPGFQPGSADEAILSELIPFLPDFRPVMISLMTPEWHYLHDSRGHAELYHWKTDPQEKVDLSASPEHQQILRDLEQRLHELAGLSARPWRGPEYLFALDGPGYSFLREIAFGRLPPPAPSPGQIRVGASQAYFAPDPSTAPRRPVPADEDLVKSLPYH